MKNMRRIVAALLVPVLVPVFAVPIEAAETASPALASERKPDQNSSRSFHREPSPTTTTTTTAAPPSTTTTAPPLTASTTTTSTTTAPTTTTTTTTPPPPPTQAPTPPAASSNVSDVAIAQVGKSYRSGATGPNAFDCSGLVFYVFNQAGIAVPRLTSDGYFARYPHVSKADLRPGDLVVYPGHIAIYVGDGQIVSASTPRGGVKHYGMNNPGRIIGFARIAG